MEASSEFVSPILRDPQWWLAESFSRRSHASSNSRADEHLVVVAVSTVDVPAVLDYHLHEGRRAGVPAMRLQGRHME
jgi:hypothetical protein